MSPLFVLFLSSLCASASAQEREPPDALAFLAPSWRPIVSVGFRAQVIRTPQPGDVEVRSARGFTLGVLAPLIATGTTRSHARLALGVGAASDFAMGTYDRDETWRGLRERFIHVYGQLGAVLRVVGRPVGLLASLVWQPGVLLHQQWTPASFAGPESERVRSLRRGRLAVGIGRGQLFAQLFFGAAYRPRRPAALREHELDFGLQAGLGW